MLIVVILVSIMLLIALVFIRAVSESDYEKAVEDWNERGKA